MTASALATVALVVAVAWLSSDGPSQRHRTTVSRAGSLPYARGLPSAAAIANAPTRAPSPPRGRPAEVHVSASGDGRVVPRDFLGLSVEAAALPWVAGYGRGGDLGALMRELGGGVIRVGGLSVDELAAWAPEGHPRPSWARTAISARELAGLAALAGGTGWGVLLDVNAAHFEPAAAAAEVARARAALGRRLVGVGIGNEPDRYARDGLKRSGWGFAGYARTFEAYRAAIARVAPGVALAAPDASSGLAALGWVSASAARLHPSLLTDHYYPLTSCGGTRTTIAQLLSSETREAESALLGRLRTIGASHESSVWVDETNDISCHGQAGVSDSFASALWAVDWIARAMTAGIAGLSFHDLLGEPQAYSPLVLAPAATPQAAAARRRAGAIAAADGAPVAPAALHANPEWYALLLCAALEGSSPLRTSVSGPAALTAHAFVEPRRTGAGKPRAKPTAGGAAPKRVRGTLRIALVDFAPVGSRPLRVRLNVPAGYARGSIVRLSASSPAARAGVTLGGSAVSASGSWGPRAPLLAVTSTAQGPVVEMRPASAALVTLLP